MAISDTDLELLETYLDEALAADEMKKLRERLAMDIELSGALDELRSQRSMRQAVWRAIEPEQAAADQLTWRIRGAISAQQTKRGFGWGQWQSTRMGAAAAACIVLGFLMGRAGHGTPGVAPSRQESPQSVAINSQAAPTAVPANAALMVPVTNEYGQVVAWQPFENPNEAKAFTEDLHRARGPVMGSSPDVRLASQEKF